MSDWHAQQDVPPDEAAEDAKGESQDYTQPTVETDGGAFIAGTVDTGGGDFVGRDKIVTNIENLYQRALTAAEEARQAQV
jgi:hypothetical protein